MISLASKTFLHFSRSESSSVSSVAGFLPSMVELLR